MFVRDALAQLLMTSLGDERARPAIAEALRLARLGLGSSLGTSNDTHRAAARTAVIACGLAAPNSGSRSGARSPSGLRRCATAWDEAVVRKLERYAVALASAPCGISLRARLAQARALFAARLFFEVHEVLEPAWQSSRGTEHECLQGLIQAAVAWYHVRRGNLRGATTLLVAAQARLTGAPAVWEDFPVDEVRRAVDSWTAWLSSGAPGEAPGLPLVPLAGS